MSSSSCTLAKPLVCAVTAPAYVLSHGGANAGGDSSGGVLCAIAAISAVGAAGGLVTGVISDIHYICGHAHEPARNIGNPFLTNVSRPR